MVHDAIHAKIDRLARVAVGAEPGDLSSLVELSELAAELATELSDANLATLGALAQRVQRGFESIIFREDDAPLNALREAHRTIDELQKACAAAAAPRTPAPPTSPSVQEAPIDASLLSAWIAGCDGMLADLEAQLLAVERNPGDAEAQAETRRIVHTFKGECGVLALHDVQRICHEAETLMDKRAECGQAPPTDLLLSLVDWMHEYVRTLAVNPTAPATGHEGLLERVIAAQTTGEPASATSPSSLTTQEVDAGAENSHPSVDSSADPLAYVVATGAEDNLADFLCEAREHLSGAEEALLALEHDATNNELINTVFRAFHTIKGVAGFIHLTPIVALAHRAEQLLDGARSGAIILARTELDLILASCDMLLKLLAMVEGREAPPRKDFESLLASLDRASASPGSGASEARPTDDGPTSPSSATPTPDASKAAPTAVTPSSKPTAGVEEATPAASDNQAARAGAAKRADQTVKVSTSRMDNLVTMVGELVIAQQMVVQDAASLGVEGQRALRTLGHVQKIVRDLQEISMALRMVSVKSTFQRMTRLVRDVAVKAGKQIVCVTEGEDVELDRNVVEEITDPLVHMVRNACDHGLEGTSERLAAGKSAEGHVFLKAYHSGGSIVIEIGDDGRGLRREKILAKAKDKGLIPADADETNIPDNDVFGLIFLPGFSTADTVTDISGRGVGMDVVRRNIELLRGKIEIRSVPGGGTTFLMRLPLTMAIIDGMVVRVGQQRYVLPTLAIEHAFRPTDEQVSTVIGTGEMVDVRGKLLPIYRLGRALGLEEGAADLSQGLFIVVETGTSKCALLVDEILGQQQVVIKNLGAAGTGVKGVAGGAILGDGQVALILDVGSIVAQCSRAGL